MEKRIHVFGYSALEGPESDGLKILGVDTVDVLDERGTADGFNPVHDNHGVKVRGHVLVCSYVFTILLDVVASGEERVFHGVLESVEKLLLSLITVTFPAFLDSEIVKMSGSCGLDAGPVTDQGPDILEAASALADSMHQAGWGVGGDLGQLVIDLLGLGLSISASEITMSNFWWFPGSCGFEMICKLEVLPQFLQQGALPLKDINLCNCFSCLPLPVIKIEELGALVQRHVGDQLACHVSKDWNRLRPP